MPLLVDYGSDSDESDNDVKDPVPALAKTSALAVTLPPPKPSTSMPSKSRTSAAGGLQLPAPRTNRRRDGPVKIRVDLLKLSGSEDQLPSKGPKKPKIESSSSRTTKGAGASSLVSMLPAPKKTSIDLPKPARVLGGGASSRNDDPGVIMDTYSFDEGEESGPHTVDIGETKPVTDFLPPSMARSKPKPSVPAHKVAPPKPAAPAMDFFSLGRYRALH